MALVTWAACSNKAAPERFAHIQNDPHAVRRLRHRAWLSLGKQCGRCSTRYCGPECQVQHWKAGHESSAKIKKAGGAEQYNANNKYAEAVAVAAEACAEDTKGQTCYICTQALHGKRRRASCAGARAAGRRAFRACVVPGGAGEDFGRGGRRKTINKECQGGRGGTRAACASNSTTASWRARSAGRAGRRTWGGGDGRAVGVRR